mgnify:CR=1 FL=1
MIMNSSYVLTSTTPFRKTRNGMAARPPGCLIKYIILSMSVVGFPRNGGEGKIPFSRSDTRAVQIIPPKAPIRSSGYPGYPFGSFWYSGILVSSSTCSTAFV